MPVSVADVPYVSFDVVGNEAETIVQDQITYLKEKADDALAELNDSLDDLRDQITTASVPSGNIDYDYVNDTIETSIGHLRPDPPDFPNTDDIDGPERYELEDITEPVWPGISTFTDPTPDDAFSWEETDYESTLLSALSQSVLNWINDGGTGLAEAVEDAYFDRARTRLTEEWENQFDIANTFHGSRSFNIPDGPKNSLLRRVNADFTRKLEDLNQKIMKDQADLAQNNTQFAHTVGLQLEQALMGHFNTVKARLMQAAKDTVVLLYELFQKKVNIYATKVDAEAKAIDAEAKKLDAKIAINKGKIDMTVADTTRYKAEIDAVISVIDGLAKVYAAEVGAYGADIDLEKINVDAKIERLKALVDQSRNETELDIKEMEVNLQGYLSSLGLNIDVTKAVSSVLAQIAASALSSINANASLSDRASRSYSGSYSHGMNLGNNKSHSYQETAA